MRTISFQFIWDLLFGRAAAVGNRAAKAARLTSAAPRKECTTREACLRSTSTDRHEPAGDQPRLFIDLAQTRSPATAAIIDYRLPPLLERVGRAAACANSESRAR